MSAIADDYDTMNSLMKSWRQALRDRNDADAAVATAQALGAAAVTIKIDADTSVDVPAAQVVDELLTKVATLNAQLVNIRAQLVNECTARIAAGTALPLGA